MPAVRRPGTAILMNLLVPGSGLIVLGRVWLGIALAAWFGLSAEVAVCGWLIAPATIPLGITAGAAVLSALAWLAGQGLIIARIRFLNDPNLAEDLAVLRGLAEMAVDRKDWTAARSALRVALSIDDGDLRTRVLWARFLTLRGKNARARRAWQEVRQLDREQLFAAETQETLDRLNLSV